MRISDWSSDVCSSDLLIAKALLFEKAQCRRCFRMDLAEHGLRFGRQQHGVDRMLGHQFGNPCLVALTADGLGSALFIMEKCPARPFPAGHSREAAWMEKGGAVGEVLVGGGTIKKKK